MSRDDATWAEIARLWSDGSMPLADLARRFGLSTQKVVAQARVRGWPARGVSQSALGAGDGPSAAASGARVPKDICRKSRRKALKRPEGNDGAATQRRRLQARRQIVDRLFDALDAKLGALEQRMAGTDDESPADSERMTRALNTLIRSFEKLCQYDAELVKVRSMASGRTRVGDGAGAHERRVEGTAEQRRAELARRIARLRDHR
ncbi:MAG: hypothetical protein AB7E80_10005 [Hyphomicrobiaceae bacterium]